MVYDNHIERRHAFWIAIGMTMLVLMLAGNANAVTLTVCKSGCAYSSIQGGINAASNADIVIVNSGTYNENVNVNKQLTLHGIGMPVVDAMRSGSAITLSADGITLEGFTATGSGFELPEAGIKVTSNNNTLSGNTVDSNYHIGISLSSSSNNTLIGNIVSSTIGRMMEDGYGIRLDSSSNNNKLIGNNVSNNYDYGISLSSSGKNMLENNTMKGNSYNFDLRGSSDLDFDNQIDTTNLVDEKPIYYIKGVRNTVYDSYTNSGTFYCIGCVNVTITNLDLKNNGNGIFFWNTTHSRIQNINVYNNANGIFLSSSSNNALISNNANLNEGYGISMLSSNNNTLIANNASENSYCGDLLRIGYGIWMYSSSNNKLIGNIASNNKGYEGYGISLFSSSNNRIFHNNLVQNQANDNSNNNSWDNGYPSGGNYWSDYTGVDLNSGTIQNIPGSDGIGDTPYSIIDGAGAQDRYPFMEMNGWILSQESTKTVELESGWNLISIPLNLNTWILGDESTVGNPLNVTPTNCLSSIYRYNSTSNLFEKSEHFDNWGWYPATGSESFTALEPGRGYWAMAQQDCSLTFTGTEPSDLDIPLDTGWNLIGWYSMNEAALGEEAIVGNPLNLTPANSLTSIYRYNATSASFEKSDHFVNWGWDPATGSEGFTKMESGRGYWLMANNDAVWRHKRW